MTIMRTPYTFLLVCAVFGCASQTRIAEPVRNTIAARHAGRTVELRQSCYYGDLYDENEKWLLSPHPFAQTYHIVDLDGVPIHPKGQRGIIPAGSRFIIKRVEFPDFTAVSMRMLTTPRYNPWIYLTPVPGSGLPTDRKAFILLLPMDMEKEEQVEAAIAGVLGDEGEVTAWLAERSPTVQVAIKHKEIAIGMTEEELLAALGSPQKWFADQRDGQSARVAWYPSTEAWFVDGKVVAKEDPRPESKPEAVPADGPPSTADPAPAASPAPVEPPVAAAPVPAAQPTPTPTE
ncbi:MAG: hypothetical protein A2341_23690 [Deltaproteobacteria bacterium RIFOXYB12_FULL_58_9]|nr:MAG: hypothetical protein A2341_23690 [Deltaproteobacteria bacterium RIFOXYB12_FULL_58_9]